MPRPLHLAAALAGTALALPALAAPQDFDFKDPKGVNGVSFVMDSKLEPIVGIVGGVAGTVRYDQDEPAAITGSVTVDLATVRMISTGMTQTLKGDDWLGIESSFPATISFERATLKSEPDAAETVLAVSAVLSFGAVELPLTLDLSPEFIAGGAEERGGAESGDLLVLRSMFQLDRKALGIKPDMPTQTVGPTIMVMAPIAGYGQ